MDFKSVRVGPFDIKIDTLEGQDAKDYLGTFDSATMAISLRGHYPTEQVRAETLIHEILHSIYRVYDIKPKDPEREERIVHAMSLGIAQSIHDNIELWDYLRDALK